MNKCMNRI